MKRYIILLFAATLSVLSCKKWDDHVGLDAPGLNETLFAQIKGNSDLSIFAGYIMQAKLDTLLNASKNLTVFAPSNEALASLPDSVRSDEVLLRKFLLGLIAGKSYYTRDESDTSRIRMLNGKRILFNSNHFDQAELTSADHTAKNGVLHIIKEYVLPLPSIWEFINATKDDYKQNAYIASLNYEVQDITTAEVDSIDLSTGETVYKPGTGIIEINTYNKKVYDLSSEDSLYTYILMTNDAFDQSSADMAPYFKANSSDTTRLNAAWSVVKDLTVKGAYTDPGSTGVLVSKYNVHLHIDPSSVLFTKKVSNGIVYVVNALSVPVEEKIPVVYIQGENPYSFSSTSSSALEDIFYRTRYNPVTKATFRDIYANRGSGGANFYIDYTTNEIYSTTYKVYWVALNDYVTSGQGDDAYGTTSNLNQIVQVRTSADSATVLFNETGTVEPYTYTETYIGEFSGDAYNWLLSYPDSTPDGNNYLINPATKFIRLQAPSSNSSPYNLTLDYLKFVPVFN